MSTVTIRVTCANPECEEEIAVECDTDGGYMYGTDADGNRGIWIAPYVCHPDDADMICQKCGTDNSEIIKEACDEYRGEEY